MISGPTVDRPAIAAARPLFSAALPAIESPSAGAPLPTTLTQVKAWLAGAAKRPIAVDSAILSAGSADALRDWLTTLSVPHQATHFCLLEAISLARLKALIPALADRPPAYRITLTCRLSPTVAQDGGQIDVKALASCAAIVQIQWRLQETPTDLTLFTAFSRAGVWNHLVVDKDSADPATSRAIALQPDILHSWECDGAGGWRPAAIYGYGQVGPLPGRPLWQAVSDPVDRSLLIDRLTKARLVRVRVDDDGDRLFEVGIALTYRFVPPDRLPTGRLDEICAMVAAGGSVAATHVRDNLQGAFLIGYAIERGRIVANSSLKHPRPAYIAAVRLKSGLDLTGYVERGYTSVRPEYRGLGIGTRLLEGLTARAGDRKIFSVIGEDNTATQIIATRNRSKKVATYFSDKAGKPVGIWMPEWMIDCDGA